jgi:hypothetical protein
MSRTAFAESEFEVKRRLSFEAFTQGRKIVLPASRIERFKLLA